MLPLEFAGLGRARKTAESYPTRSSQERDSYPLAIFFRSEEDRVYSDDFAFAENRKGVSPRPVPRLAEPVLDARSES